MDHMDQVLLALVSSFRDICCRTTVMWSVLKICRISESSFYFSMLRLMIQCHFATH